MKLNPNCIRDVMLTIEDKPITKRYNCMQLCSILPNYSEEDIYYTCIKLHEGGYLHLDIIGTNKYMLPKISTIGDLTFSGHQFLENIRNDSTWNKVLAMAKSVGSFSMPTLSAIAVKIVQMKIEGLL